MSTPGLSKRTFCRFALAVLTCTLLAMPAMAESQARIVRLSDVQGSVQIDKNTGMGFESAFLNLPITQGVQVRTRDNGRAEIEFEDGSTLHLTPNSKVEFRSLGLNDAGKRVSVVNLVEGMAYVNWVSKSDDLTLNFSRETVVLSQPAHFRVETSPTASKVAVFKGDVEITGPSGKVTVAKKKMVTIDAGDNDKYTLAKGIEEGPLDAWDKESLQYHEQYARNNTSPYGYGTSDLNYYGSYQNVAGYGMMWQPFFAGAGWDPFTNGAWSFYPGMGYMYVSSYPWGWLPYRYGNWMFVPGFGWMWQPGAWNTWTNTPRYIGTAPVGFRTPVAPAGTMQTVVVGRGGPVVSTLAPSRMVVHSGSAGMGIARGSLGNMSHLNTQVAKTGSAEIRPTPQFSATGSGANSAANRGGNSGPRPSSGQTSPARMAPSAPAPRASSSSGVGHRN
jgi:hypothetical protein